MIAIPREQFLMELTIPLVQELHLQDGMFRIADGAAFVLKGALDASAAETATSLIRRFWNCEGAVTVAEVPASLKEEEYCLEVTPDRIEVRADTPAALRYAFSTLRQLAESERGVLKSSYFQVSCLKVHDFPALGFRGIHFCWFPETTAVDMEKQIRMAAYCKFNYAVVEPWGVFPFRSRPEFGWEDKKVPLETFRRLVRLGRELGIRLIPQINIFGHAAASRSGTGKHAMLNRHPEFAPLFEADGWSWCLSNPEARKFLTDICLEIYEVFERPEFFHVGCDEAYNAGTCSLCAQTDYPKLFTEHLLYFRDLFRSRGARIMMWHDMLLDRADHRWDGFICCGTGVLSELYKTLPKDIVICDWQYRFALNEDGSNREDWVTSEFFHDAGFDTLTCPFDVDQQILSVGRHAAKYGQFGLLQTTWHLVHRKDYSYYDHGGCAGWNPEKGSARFMAVRREGYNRYLREVTQDMGLWDYTDLGHHHYQVIPYSYQGS